MYAYTCQNCGANLDPGERCDCKDTAPAPITAKRAAIAAEERSQNKTGIVMPDTPMGDSSTKIETELNRKHALSY